MFGLNVTPKNVIDLFFKLLLRIFIIFFVNNIFLLSLDLITFLIIDKSTLKDLAVSSRALVSFGKHDPP